MAVTVTPATPTSTVTTPGSTSFSVVGSNAKRAAPLAARADDLDTLLMPPTTTGSALKERALVARQVTVKPSLIPAYATACAVSAKYSSACSCAGIRATTISAPTPATVTVTVQADPSVIPVCDPADNYSYKFVGGTIQSGVELSVSSPNLTPQQCCASCFNLGSKCFFYEFYSNICYIVSETSGSLPPTDYCPYGVYQITNPGTGSSYGLGPCAKF